MKNVKTKKFVKLASFVLMAACLLCANVLPSFAANGSWYNTKTYTLNGTRGYCESNFAYNANVNYIMQGETKVVQPSSYFGHLDVYIEEPSGAWLVHDYDYTSGASILSARIQEDDFETMSTTNACYIGHAVYLNGDDPELDKPVVRCIYRGYWSSPSDGWAYSVLMNNSIGLDG